MLFELFYPFLLALLPYAILSMLAMTEGPVVTLMGGAAASSGLLLPLPVYLSVVMGNLTADLGWYGLGRFSKLERLRWLSQKLGIDPRRVDQMARGIQTHAPRMLFLAKLTVGFPIPALVATGMSRVPVRRWVGMLILGELIKSAALVFVGYLFARMVQQASAGVQVILWSITAGALVAGVIWFRRRKKAAG